MITLALEDAADPPPPNIIPYTAKDLIGLITSEWKHSSQHLTSGSVVKGTEDPKTWIQQKNEIVFMIIRFSFLKKYDTNDWLRIDLRGYIGKSFQIIKVTNRRIQIDRRFLQKSFESAIVLLETVSSSPLSSIGVSVKPEQLPQVALLALRTFSPATIEARIEVKKREEKKEKQIGVRRSPSQKNEAEMKRREPATAPANPFLTGFASNPGLKELKESTIQQTSSSGYIQQDPDFRPFGKNRVKKLKKMEKKNWGDQQFVNITGYCIQPVNNQRLQGIAQWWNVNWKKIAQWWNVEELQGISVQELFQWEHKVSSSTVIRQRFGGDNEFAVLAKISGDGGEGVLEVGEREDEDDGKNLKILPKIEEFGFGPVNNRYRLHLSPDPSSSTNQTPDPSSSTPSTNRSVSAFSFSACKQHNGP
ncbi:hypothetical protein LXL04_011684 [Taraxacum kok-saghyz]